MSVYSDLLSLRRENILKLELKTVKTGRELLGVSVPDVRAYAAKMPEEARNAFLEGKIETLSFEETLLYGFCVAKLKDYDAFLPYFYKWIPLVDNWATCDSVMTSMKIIAKNREAFYSVIKKRIGSGEEFSERIGLVALLCHYVSDEWYKKALDLSLSTRQTGYYAKMAAAWLWSALYVKYPDYTLSRLRVADVDPKTLKAAVRKVKDSYRVSSDNKRRFADFAAEITEYA